MKEVWRDVINYEGYYMVSNLGRVKSLPRNGTISSERILKPNVLRPSGYCQVSLQKHGKRTYKKVHRLVAEAFLPNKNNYPQVNHIDGNKLNNNANNLEWCTVRYNIIHSLYALKKNIRPIKQYSLDNELVREWSSIGMAARGNNLNVPNIIACAKGKQKTCGRYIWKY